MYQKISFLALILMAGANSNIFAETTITVGPSASVHVENSKGKTVVTAVGNSATVHVDSNGNSVTSSASSVRIDPKAGQNISISNHGNVSATAIVVTEPADNDVNFPNIEEPFFDDPFFNE